LEENLKKGVFGIVLAVLACVLISCTNVPGNKKFGQENNMEKLESERLILRKFEPRDFNDVWELSKNWKEAPGPDWDKWPVDENGCKSFLEYLCTHENYFAVYLREKERVIGLLAINKIDENKKLDLGHVIHSDFQNNDIDREALKMMIDYIFSTMGVNSITTGNYPEEKQIAPLKSLGFIENREGDGQVYDMKKDNWKKN
jgi:RimJ/RimL family protein N-acetyltransferase